MISVEMYRDVLPDWTRLRVLDVSEVEAATELLVAVVLLGQRAAGGDHYDKLREVWLDLLAGFEPSPRASLAAHIDTSHQRVDNLFVHPHAFGILLASACSRLRSPITQFHLMCMLMVTVFLAGPDERQVELCYRIGRKFGMEEQRVEELFSRMWTAYQAARAQSKGLDYPHEYVAGTRWDRNPALFRKSNPFEMR